GGGPGRGGPEGGRGRGTAGGCLIDSGEERVTLDCFPKKLVLSRGGRSGNGPAVLIDFKTIDLVWATVQRVAHPHWRRGGRKIDAKRARHSSRIPAARAKSKGCMTLHAG